MVQVVWGSFNQSEVHNIHQMQSELQFTFQYSAVTWSLGPDAINNITYSRVATSYLNKAL